MMETESKISRDTLAKVLSSFRVVCQKRFELHPTVLVEAGITAGLDEAVIAKRKYNVGHMLTNNRYLAKSIGKFFAILVKRWESATLLSLTQWFVTLGTTVDTDC